MTLQTPLQIISAPSPNFDTRRGPLDMLVLHYTGMADGLSALARLRDPEPPDGMGRVSAHYVVEEDGRILSLVDEEMRAWHAGQSSWDGDGDLNSRSIGVEIVNGGHDFGLPAFPDVQIEAVIALSRDIIARWSIPQRRVVGHSDIAPLRKTDPGERFPWERLAQAGVGLWPGLAEGAAPVDELPPPDDDAGIAALQACLQDIGYGVDRSGAWDDITQAALRAFQRRFRPSRITGVADAETLALLAAMRRLAGVDNE